MLTVFFLFLGKILIYLFLKADFTGVTLYCCNKIKPSFSRINWSVAYYQNNLFSTLYIYFFFQDIIVGLVLASILMVPIVPLVDRMDSFILTSQWSPFLLICISIAIIAFYPKSSIWTPTR